MTAEKIIAKLCEKLDSELYIPVRNELRDIQCTHSLGNRKENFKIAMSQAMLEIAQEFSKSIDDAIAKVSESAKNDADKSEKLSHYQAGRYKYQYALKVLRQLKEMIK